MTRQELMNECDMLKGNINRMMVSDSIDEVLSMHEWILRRATRICDERCRALTEKGDNSL